MQDNKQPGVGFWASLWLLTLINVAAAAFSTHEAKTVRAEMEMEFRAAAAPIKLIAEAILDELKRIDQTP